MFSVQVTRRPQGGVLVLRGELDYDSAVQVHEAAEQELALGRAGGPVVIDCDALSFCDSTGISALLRLRQQLGEQDRELRLATVPRSIVRLFAVTGLDQVFAVYADTGHALSAGSGGPDTRRGELNGSVEPNERQGP
ncbi:MULTISPECIES: STAS domain-containing protein [unclassified Streptomyces]|uniref:STAS domain-containing protein n=1 Tax=unclassified Streptomyces TaxID=2593676 RepID=UPI000DC38C0F|nr:STAS domain-containing protein [Streptomyces sp. PsTaAH-137]MYT68171.1 anti-sigma factor antagonist [Streptomyces sp. SID8367]RAJ72739.1 anti-sigma B factor antagonist [Streptomyces sp. PsTaAH-137]